MKSQGIADFLIVKELTFSKESTKEQNRAKLEAFGAFKEYLQEQRKLLNREGIKLQDTEAFAELQSVVDDMTRSSVGFQERAKPLIDVLTAVFEIRKNDKIPDVYKEIQKDKEWAEEQNQRLKEFEGVLASAVARSEALEREKAQLSTEKAFFGLGPIKKSALARIAEIDAVDKFRSADDINDALTKVVAQRSTIAAGRDPENPELAGQKRVLREFLDLTKEENRDRQKALIDAAVNYVDTSDTRLKSVLGTLERLGKHAEVLSDTNGIPKNMHLIMDESLKTVSQRNEDIKKGLESPAADESSISRMTREDKLQDLNEFISRSDDHAIDVANSIGGLTKHAVQIQAYKDTIRNESGSTKRLHLEGVSQMGEQLMSVVSAIVLGLQASKRDLTTPVDIVGKRFFWLNTDLLFESGNTASINEAFAKARNTLCAANSAVLVVEDAADFIKFATMAGCSNLINGLMGDLKSDRYQAIFESNDEGLAELLKCDGDLLENCTLYEVKEPTPENLRRIAEQMREELQAHHGVSISPKALEAAIALTEKYKLTELRAQPDAAITLLDLAMTHFCRQAHLAPVHIEELKKKLATLAPTASERREVEDRIQKAQADWNERQRQVRSLYKEMSDGEEQIRILEDEAEALKRAHQKRISDLQNLPNAPRAGAGGADPMMIYKDSDTAEVAAVRHRIDAVRKLVSQASDAYAAKVSEVYAGLMIQEEDVLRSFSALSGIPVDKLTENERVRLRNLEDVLGRRVVGQPEPITEVAQAVKRARLGLKLPNKPSGAFMFLGPSGVGKTELAKALSEALSVPLLRFDMSEYMEKHAVAKLIGAPPGYEGYEHGGILTNLARRNPYSVVLFDEIEKAHSDVFNLMLQLLDDARLTDSRGLTASFKDTIVIMTTNIGTPHFLDEEISFEEAKKLALTDLRSHYRPEFLGRFGGNIYAFQRLGVKVLTAIATKELARINTLVADQKVRLVMPAVAMREMVQAVYVPREGARSILGYIDRHITSAIADLVLSERVLEGESEVSFDPPNKTIELKARGQLAQPVAQAV